MFNALKPNHSVKHKRRGESYEITVREYTNEKTILLEGSHASLACPSDKGSVKVKMLEWLEVMA
jgi:hypothetical protein